MERVPLKICLFADFCNQFDYYKHKQPNTVSRIRYSGLHEHRAISRKGNYGTFRIQRQIAQYFFQNKFTKPTKSGSTQPKSYHDIGLVCSFGVTVHCKWEMEATRSHAADAR